MCIETAGMGTKPSDLDTICIAMHIVNIHSYSAYSSAHNRQVGVTTHTP